MEAVIVLIILSLLILAIFIKNIINTMEYNENGADNIFISLKGHKDDIEFMLRNAVSDVKWKNRHKNIICLDYGMDEETKKICSLMSKDYDFIYLKNKSEEKSDNKPTVWTYNLTSDKI